MTDKIRVAVRVRPFCKREHDIGTKCIIAMEENEKTIIYHPNQEKDAKAFVFDHSFWSFNSDDSHFVSQATVFKCIGTSVLENAFDGYNACIIAYGQTGSGKSYTMMGTTAEEEEHGIIPRLCNSMFANINALSTESLTFKVEVSYLEIYNERVRDLLDPKGSSKRNLKVREHNIYGPYVEGLSMLAVSSYEQIALLIEEGNKSRTVASTNMNAESSRSHALFNVHLTQILVDRESGVSGEKVSKISLVDLAGSERAMKSGIVGKRLEEGANINKSLTTLGMVISQLADESSMTDKRTTNPNRTSKNFVSYRDSVLTWLLRDNLGGNSRTVMVATISPSADNYEETLSTLHYANRAKRIVNHAVVNEDPNAKIIRELRQEVDVLRAQIREQNQTEELRERLAESERIIAKIEESWEQRLNETETIQQERHNELMKMGISVETSGIKVEKEKFYLVNLNADPSMNELLVYYVKDRCLIGCPFACDNNVDGETVDIVLQGIGVHSKHALLTVIVEDNEMFIEPLNGARTCVNGAIITKKTQLRNGNRLLIGNNHYFRVNCPTIDKLNSTPFDDNQTIEFDEVVREVMTCEEGGNSLSSAIELMEARYLDEVSLRHAEDKQAALDRQRETYEKQIRDLRNFISPMTPVDPFRLWEMAKVTTPNCLSTPIFPNIRTTDIHEKWIKSREELFKNSLTKLKTDIARANAMVREANMIASEVAIKQTSYGVTLQIPASNLRPAMIKRGAFVSEPAIIVKRAGHGGQVWNMEKFENKLIDMRLLYEDKMSGSTTTIDDPFFESQQNHSLIGVANVFLDVLLYDVHLDYQVPIISQQGEVVGRLHIELYRLSNDDETSILSDDSIGSDSMSSSSTTITQSISVDGNSAHRFFSRTITCRLRIKNASNLPTSLAHFVFCKYSFFNQNELVVASSLNESKPNNDCCCYFEHEQDFTIRVNQDFVDYVQEDALSIEVWGHRNDGYGSSSLSTIDLQSLQLNKSLHERWADVTRRLELCIEIRELNDNGHYVPVEVQQLPDVLTGGVYQLRQGQQRRIIVKIRPLASQKGQLPLVCQHIASVAIGCICKRNHNVQKSLDSYQESDLDVIREQWGQALEHRQQYLEMQISTLSNKISHQSPSEHDDDVEREQALINQWVALTEERNAVCIPAPNSNIPGAQADWIPPCGIERHIPVLFLNVNAEDLVCATGDNVAIAGTNSILPKEHVGRLISLPIYLHDDVNMSAVCSWDSSIHEHEALNRVTADVDRVYAIAKVVVRLSHPAEIDIVLRKRLCFNIYKKKTNSFAQRLMKRIIGMDTMPITSTGVYYDLVAHIPKSSFDIEDRNTLALIAARTNDVDDSAISNESYIESYTRGISQVESVLALDRLRQEVAIKEMLNRGLQQTATLLNMKRATSLPNAINHNSHNAYGSNSLRQIKIIPIEPRCVESPTAKIDSSSHSLVTNLINSPVTNTSSSSRLTGIDEEQMRSDNEDIIIKEPIRSATVPDSLKLTAIR